MVPVNIRALPGTALKPEFESFMFASIGEDLNGTPLSVLTGLARLNIDPWMEATELRKLPRKAALERLTSLVQASLGGARPLPDAMNVAERLFALLPGTRAAHAETNQSTVDFKASIKSQPWWMYVLAICFVLGSQIVIATQRQPPAKDQAANSSGAKNAMPLPPIDSGH